MSSEDKERDNIFKTEVEEEGKSIENEEAVNEIESHQRTNLKSKVISQDEESISKAIDGLGQGVNFKNHGCLMETDFKKAIPFFSIEK